MLSKQSFYFSLLLFLATPIFAQESKQNVTLEDIWKDYSFSQQTVRGVRSMVDGLNYTIMERGDGEGVELRQYDYGKGELVEPIISVENFKLGDGTLEMDDYEFSANEEKVLVKTETEAIYRRSTKARHFIYDRQSKEMQQLSEGDKEMYADFSPKGNKVAFVKNNNLFYRNLDTDEIFIITTDGEKNKIINGAADWVYEEELELSQAFAWSPDGQKIAYYKFDETEVKQWNMKMYDGLYPTDYRFKYPKAGEENAKVSIHIYDLPTNQTLRVDLGVEYEYLPNIKWTKDPKTLMVLSTNRHQSEVLINLVNAESGKSKPVLTEKSDTYIEMPFEVHFLENGKQFIILSERSGYRHIYLYNLKGGLEKQLTSGNWPVTEFYGVDEKHRLAYFQAAAESPLRREIYRIGLDGKNRKELSEQAGTNSAVFSNSFDYFINYHTTANSPYYVTLQNREGKVIRVLQDNAALKDKLAGYQLSSKEFFDFTTSEGVKLNGWMIKPPNFDETKKYPVFLTIYGGPGSQTVTDSWGGSNYFWHQLLASEGYLVVSVDNRGTGARGVDFKKITYKQMGKYETMDQIEAAKYFAGLPYVDKDRIGVQGWSYGGYMSSLCLLKGADHFKAAIAVAPVTNWRFYDSIYTERYMQTPQENPDGYDDNSPINHVEKLKGKYLLVHGMADDNVHLQNTAEMIQALVDADKQFDLFVYPNKNHGIYGGNTRFHLYTKMTEFVKENL
jgi:dipeptidyl-peptidase-4